MSEHQQKVYIKIADVGERHDAVLRVLSNIQGLKDTPEQIIASAPCYISEKVSVTLAEKVKLYLEKAGAVIELSSEAPPRFTTEELPKTDHELAQRMSTLAEPGYRLTELETTDEGALFEVDDTEAAEKDRQSPGFPSKSLEASPPTESPQRSPRPLPVQPQFDEADYEVVAEPPKRRRRRQPTQSRNLAPLIGSVLLVVILLAGIWFYVSGGVSRFTQQYQSNTLAGQMGTLDIENQPGAILRLYHVIGTRVVQQIPLPGNQVDLAHGDYYVEATKNAETLYYPVYIKGRNHHVRVAISFPDIQAPRNTVYIPAGWFRMGNKITDTDHFGFPDERPDIDVYVSGFYLSQYEVTNREFLRFIEAGGYETEQYWETLIKDWPSLVEQVPSYGRVYGNEGWNSVSKYIHNRFVDTDDRPGPRLWEKDEPSYEDWQHDYPVMGVSYYEADAYCKWRTQQTGMLHRLPKEAEWEKAARGYEGYFFSYGNEYDPKRANTESEGPQKIGSYPANSYGVYDMTGNVWEWISDHYSSEAYQRFVDTYGADIRDPYNFDEAMRYNRRIVRGGSFRSVNRINARTPVRYPMFPNDWHTNIGFRYIVEP